MGYFVYVTHNPNVRELILYMLPSKRTKVFSHQLSFLQIIRQCELFITFAELAHALYRSDVIVALVRIWTKTKFPLTNGLLLLLLLLYSFFWVIPRRLHTYPPMKIEECSETSAYKIQTPGNYTEESIQHIEHGESLKSIIIITIIIIEVLRHKNTRHRDGQQMQTVPTTRWDNRAYNISVPNTGKRTKTAW